MKYFIVTILFFCCSLLAYSQTELPWPKGLQNYNYHLRVNPSTIKKFDDPLRRQIQLPRSSNFSLVNAAAISPNSMPCFKPNMTMVVVIPNYAATTVLPVSIPNVSTK